MARQLTHMDKLRLFNEQRSDAIDRREYRLKKFDDGAFAVMIGGQFAGIVARPKAYPYKLQTRIDDDHHDDRHEWTAELAITADDGTQHYVTGTAEASRPVALTAVQTQLARCAAGEEYPLWDIYAAKRDGYWTRGDVEMQASAIRARNGRAAISAWLAETGEDREDYERIRARQHDTPESREQRNAWPKWTVAAHKENGETIRRTISAPNRDCALGAWRGNAHSSTKGRFVRVDAVREGDALPAPPIENLRKQIADLRDWLGYKESDEELYEGKLARLRHASPDDYYWLAESEREKCRAEEIDETAKKLTEIRKGTEKMREELRLLTEALECSLSEAESALA